MLSRSLPPPLLALTLLSASLQVAAATAPCRLQGIEQQVQCGQVSVAEDPDAPAGRRIDVHYAVVPALARVRTLDPIFVFAGGPGQSARRVAGQIQPLFARLNARRDIVYVDQRGTGASNPLECEPDKKRQLPSLSEMVNAARIATQGRECLTALASGNGADLRQYATWIAVRDVNAVREALGYERINLWGASYGTRAALEYLRQFPQSVRSVVLDGVAPADMALPASFAVDSQASLNTLLQNCALSPKCSASYPDLAQSIDRLLARVDQGLTTTLPHPLTGRREEVRLDRAALVSLLRVPLYAPQLAALLPYALAQAAGDNLAPLLAIGTSLATNVAENFAQGMHFAVLCAEDMPRIDPAARQAAAATRFGTSFIDLYQDACQYVPTRPVPPAFYSVPTADVPVLILSGGVDPATPPRHGDAVARQLRRATHVIAPHLGHGISLQGCAPELISGFIRQASVDGLPLDCLQQLPAPLFFQPINSAAPAPSR